LTAIVKRGGFKAIANVPAALASDQTAAVGASHRKTLLRVEFVEKYAMIL
jgi:hypothetical protein